MRQHLSGYEAFKAHIAIRQHFEKAKVNFFEGCPIRFDEAKFDNRPDKNFYHALADKYATGDLYRFMAVNIMNGCTHISEYSDVTYREWKALIGGLEYHFDNDCKKMAEIANNANATFRDLFISRNGGIPLALQMVNGNHINIETFCLIDGVLNGNIIKQMDNQVTESFTYPKLRMKVIKYQPWIVYENQTILNILKKYI